MMKPEFVPTDLPVLPAYKVTVSKSSRQRSPVPQQAAAHVMPCSKLVMHLSQRYYRPGSRTNTSPVDASS